MPIRERALSGRRLRILPPSDSLCQASVVILRSRYYLLHASYVRLASYLLPTSWSCCSSVLFTMRVGSRRPGAPGLVAAAIGICGARRCARLDERAGCAVAWRRARIRRAVQRLRTGFSIGAADGLAYTTIAKRHVVRPLGTRAAVARSSAAAAYTARSAASSSASRSKSRGSVRKEGLNPQPDHAR